MAAEKLGPTIYPNILEDPVAFVDLVKKIKSDKDLKNQSEFKDWLLGQWAQIDSQISAVNPEARYRLGSGRPRGYSRMIKFPNEKYIDEPTPQNQPNNRGEQTTLHCQIPSPETSLEDKGGRIIDVIFTTASQPARELDSVQVDYRLWYADLKKETKYVGFMIKFSSDFNIQFWGYQTSEST